MQLPTQQQFVTDCQLKYDYEQIPKGQQWEAAHFPTPRCLGGEETVLLWSADHTVQGLLQSMEFDHPCFHHNANKTDTFHLIAHHPEYLETFTLLKSRFSIRRGKKTAELKLGVHGRSAEQITADSKKGGKIGGKKIVELKVGIHARSAEQMTIDGKKAGKKAAELKLGIHAAGMQSAGGKIASAITNAQQWQCLETGHISTPGGLARYQKKRGIDTSLRTRRLDLEG